MAVAFGGRASAHRLDEVLQATRIALEPARVQLEMDLTPGVVVADGLIDAIDTDGNGVLSRGEEQAYAGLVLRNLILSVDDSPPLRIVLTASRFPDVAALRAGDGAISIRAAADLSLLATGPHSLLFRNMNAANNSVYLANALVPDDDHLAVTGQQRARDQSELTIEFVVRDTPAGPRRWAWAGLAAVFMLAAPLARRIRLRRQGRRECQVRRWQLL